MEGIYNSRLEVDLGAIGRNVARVRAGVEPHVELMPVLKGNAYAAGLARVAGFLTKQCGIKALACAQVREAAEIRAGGIGCPILVMGGVPFHNIPHAVRLGLMTPAFDHEYLALLDAECARQGRRAQVHIKVETGLNRIGARPGEELEALCTRLGQLPNLEVIGAYTHFVESEALDKAYTNAQMALFKQAVGQIRGHGFGLEYIHAFNTAAVSWMRDPEVTHIRAAGIFFGFDTCLNPVNGLGVEECLAWRAYITNIRAVQAGEGVGYNHSFCAPRDMTVATVSMGYGDGYSRHFAANQGAEMLVNGRRAKVIGICMDQTFLDITGIEARVNDTVTLVGRDGDEQISVFELQEKMGQTYLATIATITQRVERVYLGE